MWFAGGIARYGQHPPAGIAEAVCRCSRITDGFRAVAERHCTDTARFGPASIGPASPYTIILWRMSYRADVKSFYAHG